MRVWGACQIWAQTDDTDMRRVQEDTWGHSSCVCVNRNLTFILMRICTRAVMSSITSKTKRKERGWWRRRHLSTPFGARSVPPVQECSPTPSNCSHVAGGTQDSFIDKLRRKRVKGKEGKWEHRKVRREPQKLVIWWLSLGVRTVLTASCPSTTTPYPQLMGSWTSWCYSHWWPGFHWRVTEHKTIFLQDSSHFAAPEVELK